MGETSRAYPPWSRHWVGSAERYWEIPTQSKGTEWMAGWRMPGNTHIVEIYWGWGGLNWKKKIKEYIGLGWKMPRSLHCRGLNGLGWVVKQEVDLTLPWFHCPYRICRDKRRINWIFALKKRDKNPPCWFWFFRDGWEVCRSGGGLVLILCSGSMGNPLIN